MKRIVGIIFEANPFHHGHEYLIRAIKDTLNPDLIIGVTSGYFTMRGEISLLSKKNKVQILLNQGIDIVAELPIFDTLNSANRFASSSINILANLGITDLCFGAEASDPTFFNHILKIEETAQFQKLFKDNLNNNLSYKVSYLNTVEELIPGSKEVLQHANATLALEYLRCLSKYPSITPHVFKRMGNDEEISTLDNFASGTAIRDNYLQGNDVSKFISYDQSLLTNLATYKQNMHTLTLAMFNQKHYLGLNNPVISEGIEHYLENNYQFDKTFDDNLNLLANKKYTKSRIRRSILSLMLEIDSDKVADYTRVLGFSETGLSYLRQTSLNNVIMNITSKNKQILQYELKTVFLYSLLVNHDYTIEEYQFPLKRKD